MPELYVVDGLSIRDALGGIVYDLLDSPQAAHDICTVLNSGTLPEDWTDDDVQERQKYLVVVKILP